MEIDYIIVGFVIAGLCFSKQLLDHNNSIIVFSDSQAGATLSSGVLVNPIVLRMYTAPKYSIEYTEYALKMFLSMQQYSSEKWMYPKQKVYRIFASIEEQNNWFAASDKPHLKPFISSELQKNTNPYITADFDLGKVTKSFKIDSNTLVRNLHEYFQENNKLKVERFDYQKLDYQLGDYPWQYKSIKAKSILFAEGTEVVN